MITSPLKQNGSTKFSPRPPRVFASACFRGRGLYRLMLSLTILLALIYITIFIILAHPGIPLDGKLVIKKTDNGKGELRVRTKKGVEEKKNVPRKMEDKIETEQQRERRLLQRNWTFEQWSTYRRELDHKFRNVPVPGTEEGNRYYAPAFDKYEFLSSEVGRRRKDRFPSVEERIKFYMGEFYDPPTNKAESGFGVGPLLGEQYRKKLYGHWTNSMNIPRQQDYMIDSVMVNPLRLEAKLFIECAEFSRLIGVTDETTGITPTVKLWEPKVLKSNYCRDAVDLILLWNEEKASAPLLMHFKDFIPVLKSNEDPSIFPLFNKVRDLTGGKPRGGVVPLGHPYHCIIWPLNRRRHLIPPAQIVSEDTPWEQKIGGVVLWRGDYNVANPAEIEADVEVSGPKQKWILVHNYSNSSFVDAKYHSPEIHTQFIPEEYIVREPMQFREMLKYKYLISIEGHDMSSGLKWMLYSNSLVFLPPITYDSWAMESLLQPFVHYVPVHADMSDLEEMIRWADNHQAEAKRIAYRGKLFVYDLLFHPDAMKDEESVLRGIVKRYHQNFGWGGHVKRSGAETSVRESEEAKHIFPDFVHEYVDTRVHRFPNVEERVKHYMGKWYRKKWPCMEYNCTNRINEALNNSVPVLVDPLAPFNQSKQIELDREILSDAVLSKCLSSTDGNNEKLTSYCKVLMPDFNSSLPPHLRRELHMNNPPAKIVRFADGITNVSHVPVFVKHRRSVYETGEAKSELSSTASKLQSSFHPEKGIIWQFDYTGDYEMILSGLVPKYDLLMESKKAKAFWRGGIGSKSLEERTSEFILRLDFVRRANALREKRERKWNDSVASDALRKTVEQVNTSPDISSENLVDAKFSFGQLANDWDQFDALVGESDLQKEQIGFNAKRGALSSMTDMDDTWSDQSDINENEPVLVRRLCRMLSFKYLVVLEDDYRSNPDLKWMLLSNSIVFMVPKPRFVTWFMEDKLEPYVHFIPIRPDLSDVHDMVKWCESRPDIARNISRRATLFVYDMLFHPMSDQDNAEVKYKITSMYNNQFKYHPPSND